MLVGPTLFGFLYDVVLVRHPSSLPVVDGPGAATATLLEEFEDDTPYQRLQAGFKYSFGSLLVSTAPWLVLGFALGSMTKLLVSIAPDSIVSQYFADPGIIPLLVAAGFAAITYI